MKGSLYLGSVVALSVGVACGFRSDPFNGGLICTAAADTDGPAEGSCEMPFILPGGTMTVAGMLDGCSNASGWCDARGPEHYYKLTSGEGDVTVTFTPQADGVVPILRVIRIEPDTSPCGFEPADVDTEVCVPMQDGRNRQSFYRDPGYDYYIAVDSAAASSGAYQFRVDLGAEAANAPYSETDACSADAMREETIVLGRGGVFTWESTLAEGQGQIDGRWGGPGTEHMFVVSMIEGGNLWAKMESIDQDFEPAISLRRGGGCAGSDAQSGGGGMGLLTAELSQFFEIPSTRFLVLDNRGVGQASYRMQIGLK